MTINTQLGMLAAQLFSIYVSHPDQTTRAIGGKMFENAIQLAKETDVLDDVVKETNRLLDPLGIEVEVMTMADIEKTTADVIAKAKGAPQ